MTDPTPEDLTAARALLLSLRNVACICAACEDAVASRALPILPWGGER